MSEMCGCVQRAAMSAELVGQACGHSGAPVLLPELAEMNYGVLDGKMLSDVSAEVGKLEVCGRH